MKFLSFFVFGLLLVHTGISQTTIKGQLANLKGEVLNGANVLVLETGKGAITGQRGDFEIDGFKAGSYTLEFSYVGYKTQQKRVAIGLQQSVIELDIQLEETAVSLSTLTVKATRADLKTPMTYVNLQEEEIRKYNLGQDVPFLLRWTPSAVVTSDAGAGIGYTGIRIRGTDPTRINVTINGIPLNDAESQGVFWVNMPDFASSTSDIQVQRGVGSSTNGASAFGATINMNTSRLQSQPYAELNASVGSFNTQKANIEFGTGLLKNKFTIDGRLSRITSDGYIDRATADLSSYYLSTAYVGSSSSLRFNLFSGHEETYQAWYGVPRDSLGSHASRTYNPSGTEKEGAPHDNEVDNYRQTHYQLLFDHQLSSSWALNLSLHYTKGQGYFEQYKAGQTLTDYSLNPVSLGDSLVETTDLIRRLWLDNDFYGGVFAVDYQNDNSKLDLSFGGGYHRYEGEHFGEVIWAEFASNGELGDRYYENDAFKGDFNIYGKASYAMLDGLDAYLDLQYRRVDYDFLGINRSFENVRDEVGLNFFNPKLGLFYQMNRQQSLYGSFAVANREPNRNDYVESTVDSRPKPERLYDTELGYKYRGNKSALEATVYYMAYQDQLALNGQVNDVGAYTRINVDRSYRLGVELSGGVQLLKPLRVDGNVTISRNRIEAFSEFVDVYDENFNWLRQDEIRHQDTDLSFSPAVIAALGLTVDLLPNHEGNKSLELGLNNKYVGKQYIDNTSNEDNIIAPYWFSDLSLRFGVSPSWGKRISLNLTVQNAFDQLYEANAWSYRYVFDGAVALDQGFFPQAGRNFLLGLNVSL
jgi:iron complex outermembrane receptor protein